VVDMIGQKINDLLNFLEKFLDEMSDTFAKTEWPYW